MNGNKKHRTNFMILCFEIMMLLIRLQSIPSQFLKEEIITKLLQ